MTVTSSVSNDKLIDMQTGEIHYPRSEGDASLDIEGTGEAAWGCKQGSGKSRKRVEKTTYVETKTVNTPAGTRDVKLFARGGQIGLTELTDGRAHI